MKLGAYEVEREIGRGGAGVVLAGRGPDGRPVALKVLRRPSPEALARFERERRLLAELGQGEGFVPLLDAGDGPQGPWLAMPFIAGGSLRDRLRRGPLAIDEAIALAKALALAAGRAHGRGLVHRDLKPENILFDGEGRPLVADLGLAKHFATGAPGASVSVALTKSGEFRGTAGYMPPEQMTSSKEVGPEADVFALGAILYECLTGQPAFDGDSLTVVLAKVASGTFTAVRSLRPETPRWLAAVVARAMDRDPTGRPRDGNALLASIESGPAVERAQRTLAVAGVGAFVLSLAVLVVVLLAPRRATVPQGDPAAPAVPPSVATPSPAPTPSPARPRTGAPEWYFSVERDERPPLPLPKGLAFGDAPGEYVNVKDGSVLLYLARGGFSMGAIDGRQNERPVHEVELSAFFVGKLEVKVKQFAAFVAATGHATQAEKEGSGHACDVSTGDDEGREQEGLTWRSPRFKGPAATEDEPVAQVAWVDVRAYCAWAGLRLPTEAEWERAAAWDRRARASRRFPWGNEPPGPKAPRVANLADASFGRAVPGAAVFEAYDDGFPRAAPVGSFPNGASAVGALDLLGNVAEWVEDGFDNGFFARAPLRDPIRAPDGAQTRVARGGSFARQPGFARASQRDEHGPFIRCEDLGFRVARGGY